MKNTLAVLLSALAWLQSTEAACCRTNECLKAIVNPLLQGQGLADCSSLLAVTVTESAATATATSTVTLSPVISIEQATVVDTEVETQTETSHASTETQVLTTVTDTTTVTTSTSTRTNNVLVIGSTGTVTQTPTTTITLAPSTVTVSWTAATTPVGRRDVADVHQVQVPSYAAPVCPSWDSYVAACRCAGITSVPTVTVTEAPAVTTVVVTEEPPPVVETSTVLSTLVSTTTETIAITVTTQATQTDMTSTTAVNTVITWTTRPYATVTITGPTTTATVTPSPVSLACQDVPRSYIRGTSSTGVERTLYADVQNGMAGVYGGGKWIVPGSIPNTPEERVLFGIDANGNVNFMTSGSLPTVWYINTRDAGNTESIRPQIMLKSQFDYYVANGQPYIALKGCADQATGNLLLNLAGRTNPLFCNDQFYISGTSGSDVGGMTCTRATLKMVAPA